MTSKKVGLPPESRDCGTKAEGKSLGNPRERERVSLMGNSQGRDNVKKRAARRKKTERLAAAKKEAGKKAAKK